jgi:hypothetical protein
VGIDARVKRGYEAIDIIERAYDAVILIFENVVTI